MKDWTLTPEVFERLLDWLNADRDQAARDYEDIRRRLIKMFTCRGCYEPEDQADKTIDRVAGKLQDIKDYVGPRAPYFYVVAANILREWLRGKRVLPTAPPPPTDEDKGKLEQRHKCLDECMKLQSAENQEIVLQYYQQEKRAKIDRRKRLAERLGITLNALRIRAFRIRFALQDCVQVCMKRQGYEIG
jgi:DNA-directed RNA polymerase specialized sigma24 family protein